MFCLLRSEAKNYGQENKYLWPFFNLQEINIFALAYSDSVKKIYLSGQSNFALL